jgi:hypothetical protein
MTTLAPFQGLRNDQLIQTRDLCPECREHITKFRRFWTWINAGDMRRRSSTCWFCGIVARAICTLPNWTPEYSNFTLREMPMETNVPHSQLRAAGSTYDTHYLINLGFLFNSPGR